MNSIPPIPAKGKQTQDLPGKLRRQYLEKPLEEIGWARLARHYVMRVFFLVLIGWSIWRYFIYLKLDRRLLESYQNLPYALSEIFSNTNIQIIYPFMEIFVAFVGQFLIFLFGLLVIRCGKWRIKFGAGLALAYPVGISVLIVPMELLGMVGAFRRIPILIMLLIVALPLILWHRSLVKRGLGKGLDNPFVNWNWKRKAAVARFIREDEQDIEEINKTQTALDLWRFTRIFIISISIMIISLITASTFLHGIFYPPTYWDALIYYIYFGKLIFLQGGFPFMATAQVGLGLGANYPHMFNLMHAMPAVLTGKFSIVYSQAIAPLAGVCTLILVYKILRNWLRSPLIALVGTLIFRVIPYSMAFNTYPSDYALVMMFTAAFLYCALIYYQERYFFALLMAGLIAGGAPHINYMMWMLWPLLLLVIIQVNGIKFFKISRRFVILPVLALLLGLPWYIRNWVMTGNPVYAFFPNIFGGININPEVLTDCQVEWQANGDGIGTLAKSLTTKIFYTWTYFMNRWIYAPVLVALALPGAILLIWRRLPGRLMAVALCFYYIIISNYSVSSREQFTIISRLTVGLVTLWLILGIYFAVREKRGIWRKEPFMVLILTMTGIFIFYHYFISSLYLYHVISITLVFSFLSAYYLNHIPWLMVRRGMIILVMFLGFCPGIPFAIMGFSGTPSPSNEMLSKFGKSENDLLYYGLSKILTLQNGQLVRESPYPVWYWANENLPENAKIMSHENRYLYFRDDLKIIHMDDMDMQAMAKMETDEEKLAHLKEHGIKYYLYIPNEENYPFAKKVGMFRMAEDKTRFRELHRNGRYALYEIFY